jgi:hypothetical protein
VTLDDELPTPSCPGHAAEGVPHEFDPLTARCRWCRRAFDEVRREAALRRLWPKTPCQVEAFPQ